MVASPLLIQ